MGSGMHVFTCACMLPCMLPCSHVYTCAAAQVALFLRCPSPTAPCRYFRTPHALSNMGQSCHTATTGPTMAHYTLTASKRRIAILQAAWERDEPGKHATCSISHKGGLGCSDYHEQLRFMAAQDRTPTRPLAPLCMTPLVGSETSRYEEPADWNALFAGSGLV